MAYEKTTWVPGETKISATNFNHMEEGIGDAHDEIKSLNDKIDEIIKAMEKVLATE